MQRQVTEAVAVNVNSLEWNLECAVISGWQEIAGTSTPERIHLTYTADDKGQLDRLQLWSSVRRGHWDLVCDYRAHKDSDGFAGVAFSNGFNSARLIESLNSVMTRQSWLLPAVQLPKGTIQIGPPTKEALSLATRTLEALKSNPPEPKRS
jgi:hypothetical protein